MLIFSLIMYALIGLGIASALVELCHKDPDIDTSGKVWPEKTPMWFMLTMVFLIWPAIAAYMIMEKTDG